MKKKQLIIRGCLNFKQPLHKRKIFLLLLPAFLFFACTSNNESDKYGGGSEELLVGELAWFPLDGDLSNEIEESNIQLAYIGKGTPEFVSGAGIDASQALKLNGEDNYLMIPAGVYDTLSVVFWVKTDNKEFRLKNPNPVWFDYGMGAVKVSVDGISEATKLLVAENTMGENPSSQLLPSGEWTYACSWNLNLFYIEILKGRVSFRLTTRYQSEKLDCPVTIDRQESPLNIKSDVLYIGRSSGTGPYSGGYLQGIVDDIHIYNRGLTEAEVNAFAQKIPLD
jgi:hypothetical protein